MYAATVGGRRLHFHVVAMWRGNAVVRDRETRTLWLQATGEALLGPLAGQRLELIGAERMNWSQWRAEHPQTEVVQDMPRNGLLGFVAATAVIMMSPRFLTPARVWSVVDPRLPPKEDVVGVVVGSESRAYPLSALRRAGTLEDVLGGKHLVLSYRPEGDWARGALQDAVSGSEPVHVWRTTWKGWIEFHPDTTVYRKAVNGKTV